MNGTAALRACLISWRRSRHTMSRHAFQTAQARTAAMTAAGAAAARATPPPIAPVADAYKSLSHARMIRDASRRGVIAIRMSLTPVHSEVTAAWTGQTGPNAEAGKYATMDHALLKIVSLQAAVSMFLLLEQAQFAL